LTTIDWLIIGFTILLAVWGYAQGLIVGAFSLGGFAAGALLGARLAPLLLEEGSKSPYAPLFGLIGGLMLGSVIALVLESVGSNIRRRLTLTPLAAVDGVLGAVFIGALALGLAWLGGAAALQTPGATDLRREIQRSTILRWLNDTLPPSGPLLNALSRVDPFPSVAGPPARVPAPTRGILADPEVKAARRSVVRIQGTACGLAVEGSGWVARPGIVVTNAHVIAGQDDTSVELEDGVEHDAEPVAFDSHNDIAILRVPDLEAPPLRQAGEDRVGASVAILGYPEDGPYRSEPGRLGATQTVISQDAYGVGPIRRRITAIRGRIRSGNSGGPAVDARGEVAATVFAAAQTRRRSGFGLPPSLVAENLRRAGGAPVDSGPCVR
jgi:S1-C subfamily serine protease